MTLSVRLSETEDMQLKRLAERSGKSKSDLVRQALIDLLRRSDVDSSPYELGKKLFDKGQLAPPPPDPLKRQIWEKLSDKHDIG
jgi:predicted transcriptional regulator